MYSKKVVISNSTGLHARPASEFVKHANSFKSNINIVLEPDKTEINGKSIIMILSAGISKGKEIEIIADGDDEVSAVNELVDLVNSGFGE